ncbi:MAG: penicillin-binding protein activator LpoB [Synechococcales cyanobacterium M58_A2018_015]|nr:penicillin-binding protein activator LpoB [Synechococcales cyanobacterium M58_A2018_015]
MNALRPINGACLSCVLLITGISTLPLLPPAVAQDVQLAQAQRQGRLRIAVLDFDYASTGADYWWYGNRDVAQGVSDLLTNKLVQDGTYTLIERSRIAEVLQEQNLAQAGRIDPSTAAQIGRILGADAVVLGSVTRFNLDERGGGGSFFGFGGSGRTRTAEVELTARIVNTTTAEIITAAQGSGTSEQGTGGVSIPFFGGSGRTRTAEVELTARIVNTTTAEIITAAQGSGTSEQGTGGVSIPFFGSVGTNASNDDALLSNAADAAVTQLAQQLSAAASRLAALPQVVPVIDATVADVSGNTVIINRGSQDGFRTGMVLSIERVEREVTDPETGEVLRTVTSPVGRIELTEVDTRSGVGRIVSGSGFQVGDKARAIE